MELVGIGRGVYGFDGELVGVEFAFGEFGEGGSEAGVVEGEFARWYGGVDEDELGFAVGEVEAVPELGGGAPIGVDAVFENLA